MATEPTDNQKDINSILSNYHTPEHLRSGVYANALTVNMSDVDVTLNFVYLNPSDKPMGTLVSRVIISPAQADVLIDTLNKAKQQYIDAKAEQEKL